MRTYIVSGIAVTGTPESPQTILYSSLTDVLGATVPTTFEANVGVKITYKSADVGVYITEAPGTTSFKVARSNLGEMYGALTIGIEITADVPTTTPTAGENAMPLEEMLSMLGSYLQDENNGLYPLPLKAQNLNMAQLYLIRQITKANKSGMIATLQAEDTDLALNANSAYQLSGLTYEPFEGTSGIVTVQITDAEFCDRMTYDEYRMLDKLGFSYSTSKPKCYFYGGYVYILPTDSSNTIDIRYIRRPVKMSLGATVSANVDCELEDEFHPLIVGLACEPYITKLEPARIAFEHANNQLQEMIEGYSISDTARTGVMHLGVDEMFAGTRYNILTNK